MIETNSIRDIVQRINERGPFAPQAIRIEVALGMSGLNECSIISREAGNHSMAQLNLDKSLKPDWILNQLKTYSIPYNVSDVQEVNGRYSVTLSPK